MLDPTHQRCRNVQNLGSRVWAPSCSLAATNEILYWYLFLQVLRCFTSLGMHSDVTSEFSTFLSREFPHSDISGSKVAWHLPEAYRRHAASFIAFQSLGIHHTPLLFPFSCEGETRNLRTAIICCLFFVTFVHLHKSKRPIREISHGMGFSCQRFSHSPDLYPTLLRADASQGKEKAAFSEAAASQSAYRPP